MKVGPRGALARAAKDARLAAAGRYREALADGAKVRRYRAGAAVAGTVLRARRAMSGAPHSRLELADAAAAVRHRLRRRDTLLVERAAVGGVADLSLALRGPAAACAAVRAVTLVPVDGDTEQRVDTLVRADGETVRIAASLPRQLFSGRVRRWRVEVTDGTQPLPLLVASRSALVRRWGADVMGPLRVELDADRRLLVTGCADAAAGVEHAVSVGLTSATFTWRGPAAELRCTPAAGGAALSFTGHRDAGGECTVTLALLALGEQPPGCWEPAVDAGTGGWQPLVLAPGRYPPLDTAQVVRLRRADATTVPVRVGYPRDNRLTVEVGE